MTFLMLTMPIVFSVTIVPGSTQVIDVTDSSATIKWRTNMLSNGKVEYGISISQIDGLPEEGAPKIDHSVEINGLSSGQKYFYQAVSWDGNGLTSSDFYSFTTNLVAPSGLRHTNLKYNSVDLNWNKITGAVKYKVYQNNAMIVELDENTYSLIDLSPETDYSIQVSVIDSKGKESIKSEALTFKTPAKSINITFIQASSITNTDATISWSTDENIACQLLYDQDSSLDLVIDTVASKTHSVSLSNLISNKRYYYQIKCKETLSPRLYFQTLEVEPVLQITNIAVSEITKNSAKITWETNSVAKSKVLYSMDDTFNQIKSSVDAVTSHEMILDNLNSGATYYFKVESNEAISPYQTFDTEFSSTQNFIILNPVKDITNNRMVEISGRARIDSRIYIFINDKEIAQVRKQINGTEFNFNIILEPNAAYEDQFGRNFVKIYGWDKNGNKDEKSFYVTLDTTAPDLILFDFPQYTKESRLTIKGSTEPNSKVQFFINEQGHDIFNADANGSFSHEVGLGNEGTYNFSVVSTDLAGNEKKITKEITVDRTKPDVDFNGYMDWNKETHFKLFKIRGKTDPGAKITVVNFGHYSGYCGDTNLKGDYGSCEKFIQDEESYTKLMSIIDPVSFGLGMKIKTTADDKGEFEVTVSLISNGDDISENHLMINVTDKGGLTTSILESIKYKPGCGDWSIGKIDSYPFNINTRQLYAGGFNPNALFPIYYLGTGTPKVTSVHIDKDDSSNHGYLMADKDDHSELFEVADGSIVTAYDTENENLRVYIPLRIKKYSGSIDDLPGDDVKGGQLNSYLRLRLSYAVDGKEAHCELYPVVSFVLHKPEETTSWLSPTMINNTIKNIDKLINISTMAIEKLEMVQWAVLAFCGANVAIDYLKGFTGFEDNVDDTGCTSVQLGMETTFYACDRLLCPNVPYECNSFEAEGNSDEYEDQANINRDWKDEYYRQKELGNIDNEKFEVWQEKNKNDYNHGTYDEIPYEKIPNEFTYKPDDDSGGQKGVSLKYIGVDEHGDIINKDTIISHDKNGNVIYASDAVKAARDCKGGTLIEYKVEDDENSEPGYFIMGNEIQSSNYQCEPKYTPSEMGVPDTKGVISGCYNKDCPTFDNTKCFGTDGIMPAKGIFSSMKCGCIPGTISHLQNWIKIMNNIKRCLESALIGEVRGAFCERILSQFICDVLIELFRIALSFVDESSAEGKYDPSGGLRGSITNYKTNSKLVSEGLSNRYENIMTSKMKMSSDQLVNKVCMFAFTKDYSLMDGLLTTIVNSVEIAPQAEIMASSTPGGTNPFTGTMNINYDISIGVVPGGETRIKVWLECDPNLPDARFCNGPEFSVKGVPSVLRKNDPALSKNFMFTDQNAKIWYNKVVMQLDYEIGGKPEREKVYATIHHTGDVVSGCDFSLINGFTCEIFKQFSQEGIVELFSESQGTTLSPNIAVYGNGDSVNALVKMRNSFTEDFYLIAQYPDGKKKEYRLNSAQSSSNSDSAYQTYNIWLDSVDYEGGISGANDQTVIIQINDETKENNVINYFGIKLPPQLKQVHTKIKSKVMIDDKWEDIEPFDCLVYNKDELNAPGGNNEKYRFGDYNEGNFEVEGKGIKEFDRLTNDDYYLCMIYYDEFNLEKGGTIIITDNHKIIINEVILTFPSWVEGADKDARIPIDFYGLQKIKQDGVTFKESNSNSPSSRSKTITLNVYQLSDDKNSYIPIVYAGGPGDQTVTLNYKYGIPVDDDPRFDLIEPPGMYMNNDGDPVPIAINAWNADSMTINIKSRKSGKECNFEKLTPGPFDNLATTDCGKMSNGRTTFGSSNAPPFIEFYWDYPKDDEKFPMGPTDIYEIEIIVKNKDKEMKKGKSVSFGAAGTKIKQEDLMICLGSGSCSGSWSGPQDTTKDLGTYDASNMPSVSSN